MSKVKKLLAIVLSLAMIMGMSLTTFAATAPTENDKKIATVNNVEAGATVTAYQIVKAKYDTNGFTGYTAVDGVTLKDPTAPTSDEVATIAANIQDKSVSLNSVVMTQGTASEEGFASYTADLNAGYWIVLVTGTDIVEVYNPMLMGVYYSVSGSDNTMTSQPIDANANWTLVTEMLMQSQQNLLLRKPLEQVRMTLLLVMMWISPLLQLFLPTANSTNQ